MEKPRSEGHEDRGRNNLIRDISRGSQSSATQVTLEQDLMRLAEDPLLVRDFIHRIGPSGPVARTAPPMPVEATLAVAGAAAAWAGLGTAGGPTGEQRFESPLPYDDESIFPFAFRPTVEDRKRALNHFEPVAPEQAQARYGVALAAAIFILAIFLFLILMLQD